MQHFDDTFLARWIVDNTSTEENAAFKNHHDYNKYLKIKQASENLSFSEFDEELAFDNLKTKLKSPNKPKIIPLYTWGASIAACAVIIFGFFFFLNQNSSYSTTVAENNTVNLPDGSVMVLNASAKAKVNSSNWEQNRTVFLEGEAFFKVKKGSKFTVNTPLGNVQVLGTQFTVNTIGDKLITVKCFEGKVKIITSTEDKILAKGMAFQDNKSQIETWGFNSEVPTWLTAKKTSLYKVPVEQVITLMKRQYNLKIQHQELLNKEQLFTGTFSNKDLEKALYSVFKVLGVEYTLVSENEIRILPR